MRVVKFTSHPGVKFAKKTRNAHVLICAALASNVDTRTGIAEAARVVVVANANLAAPFLACAVISESTVWIPPARSFRAWGE